MARLLARREAADNVCRHSCHPAASSPDRLRVTAALPPVPWLVMYEGSLLAHPG
ncbi:hypothetical protein ACQB60_10240 [Actinomycetota bacterium Odt1-20B]